MSEKFFVKKEDIESFLAKYMEKHRIEKIEMRNNNDSIEVIFFEKGEIMPAPEVKKKEVGSTMSLNSFGIFGDAIQEQIEKVVAEKSVAVLDSATKKLDSSVAKFEAQATEKLNTLGGSLEAKINTNTESISSLIAKIDDLKTTLNNVEQKIVAIEQKQTSYDSKHKRIDEKFAVVAKTFTNP